MCYGQVLATSLFEDLAAGLYEDASARLCEHPALLRLLDLAPDPRAGGHLDLPAGDEELPDRRPTRSRNVTACGAVPLLIRLTWMVPSAVRWGALSRITGLSACAAARPGIRWCQAVGSAKARVTAAVRLETCSRR